MGKKGAFESPNKNSSKKWINADGTKVPPVRSPKVADKSKPAEIPTEEQKLEVLLKNVEVEPLSINLPHG